MRRLNGPAATLMRGQWLVGEALYYLKHLTAVATLVFIHWHVGVIYCPPTCFARRILRA